MTAAALADSGLYERDFYAWTQEQAAALRRAVDERVNLPLDWENVAEEIESLGRSDKREIRSRLEALVEHLLKLGSIPDDEPRRGWKLTVLEQRRQLDQILEDSPSLASYPEAVLQKAYATARLRVAVALDRNESEFPERCPYELGAEILKGDWYPEPPKDDQNA